MLAGFGAAVGVGVLTASPPLLLVAGLLVTASVAAGGLWLALRGMPPGRRRTWSAVGAAVLTTVVAAGALEPPPSSAEPEAVDDQAYWELDTGSRLAYVHLPAPRPSDRVPVVVLHGGPGIPDMAGDAAYFGQLTDTGHDVYVYDQLGAGHSSRLADPTGYGIERDVADLEAVRRTVGADRLVLVGHSYGGTLATHYTAAHPERVASMVLSSPGPLDPADRSGGLAAAGLGFGRSLRLYAAALRPRALMGYTLLQADPAAAHAYLGDDEADARNDHVLDLAEPALHCGPDQGTGPVRGSGFYAQQYPQSASAPPHPDVRPALERLPVPVLLLKGSCDYLSWSSVQDYRGTLPDTTLVYLDGAGHNTYEDRPDEVLGAMRAFLAGQPVPGVRTEDARPADYRGPA